MAGAPAISFVLFRGYAFHAAAHCPTFAATVARQDSAMLPLLPLMAGYAVARSLLLFRPDDAQARLPRKRRPIFNGAAIAIDDDAIRHDICHAMLMLTMPYLFFLIAMLRR